MLVKMREENLLNKRTLISPTPFGIAPLASVVVDAN